MDEVYITQNDLSIDKEEDCILSLYLALNFLIRYVISSAHLTTYKPQRFVILHTNPVEKNLQTSRFVILTLHFIHYINFDIGHGFLMQAIYIRQENFPPTNARRNPT